MAQAARQLIVAKGKKITRVDLQAETPSAEVLAGLMLGPTGNLRAPLLRVGSTIVVGYNEPAFTEIFGEVSLS